MAMIDVEFRECPINNVLCNTPKPLGSTSCVGFCSKYKQNGKKPMLKDALRNW